MATRVESLSAEIERMEVHLRGKCAELVAAVSPRDGASWHVIVDSALKAGLNLRQLALVCGTATSTVSRWADGTSVPSDAARRWVHAKLCEMLNVTPQATEPTVSPKTTRKAPSPRRQPEDALT